jgi:hypothetical protein
MTMPAPANPLIEAKRALNAAAGTINQVQADGGQLDLHTLIVFAQAQATLALADGVWAMLHNTAGVRPGALVVPGR